jgi:hypothetical protein
LIIYFNQRHRERKISKQSIKFKSLKNFPLFYIFQFSEKKILTNWVQYLMLSLESYPINPFKRRLGFLEILALDVGPVFLKNFLALRLARKSRRYFFPKRPNRISNQ